jgi:hypothetical protein
MASAAYLISTEDRELQGYLQHWPFLTGPDEKLNRAGLALLRRGPQVRSPTNDAPVTMLSAVDCAASDQATSRAKPLTPNGFGFRSLSEMLDDYAWKVSRCPIEPNAILSVGCGGGEELAMLRAHYPKARIVAVDRVP